MSGPEPSRRHAGTAAVVVVAAAVIALRLWSVGSRDGAGGLLVAVAAIVVVGGGLVLVIWRQMRSSGERMASKARGMGFMAGSVWYSAAVPLDQPASRGLLVVRRTGIVWLPQGLDPSLVRELPIEGLAVFIEEPARRVTAGGLGTFRVHSVKALRTALDSVGVPVA